MAILKVIEVLSSSEKSWEDAAAKAVKKASRSVKGIKSVFVQSQSAVVENGRISEYRLNLKLTFAINK